MIQGNIIKILRDFTVRVAGSRNNAKVEGSFSDPLRARPEYNPSLRETVHNQTGHVVFWREQKTELDRPSAVSRYRRKQNFIRAFSSIAVLTP